MRAMCPVLRVGASMPDPALIWYLESQIGIAAHPSRRPLRGLLRMRSNLLKHNNLMLRSERRERLEAWAASDSHISQYSARFRPDWPRWRNDAGSDPGHRSLHTDVKRCWGSIRIRETACPLFG